MATAEPSAFFRENEARLVEAARLGPALDLACGRGRHALATARLGIPCVAIDRSAPALAELAAAARAEHLPVLPARTDLETGHGIPVAPGAFGAVLVFRYLWRPLAPAIAGALRPGGLLLYETFTHHQRKLGQGPGNPAFLLEDGELPRLFPDLEVLVHREGLREGERPAHLAALAARRPA